MNFDIIKKLIRLANNNPNENEANLAARKVCSMLKDYQFISTVSEPKTPGTKPPDQKYPRTPWNYQPSREQEDWFRKYASGFNPGFSKQWTAGYPFDQKDSPQTDKERTCSKCGLVVNTSSTKEPFICTICSQNFYKGF